MKIWKGFLVAAFLLFLPLSVHAAGINGIKISSLTAETSPVGADQLAIVDASANTTDKVTITTLFENVPNVLTMIGSTPALTIGTAGVKFTGDDDGAFTILSLGNGTNEDLTINLDDVPDEVTFSSSTGVTLIDFDGALDLEISGSDLTLGEAGVKMTGDGDGAITFLGLGDGFDEDLKLNLDDTENTGVFTSSTSLATLNFSGIVLQESGINVLNNDEIDASSELLAIMDDETGTGVLVFATAPTFTTSLTVTGGAVIDADGVDAVSGNAYEIDGTSVLNATTLGVAVVSSSLTSFGELTRTWTVPDNMVILDGTSPPGATSDIGTNGQALFNAWSFDADGGSTGDDIVFINWIVPAGYVTDSARLNVYWSFDTAEDAADECDFDCTVNAVAEGEAMDAAGTAVAAVTTVVANASTDNGKLFKDQINIEVEVIAVGDMVTIKFWVDESASAMASSGSVDIHNFEIEWEATE